MRDTIKKLLLATFLFILSITIGTVGFMYIEHFSFVDALYMSVITLSTVGFSEVNPLTDSGKLFSVLFIIMNLGILAYTVSVVTSILFEGEFRKIFKTYIVSREVKKLQDHIIVCGFGRNGEKACEELANSGKPFVVIEKESNLIESVDPKRNYNFVLGNATADETLLEAGIARASTVITTLPSDADNVFITLTAKEINPSVNVIAKASEASSEKKLLRAGASHVVMPDRLGGIHMANLVTKPYVIEFLELLNGVGDGQLELEEVDYGSLQDTFKTQSLRELDIRNKTGATIIAFKDDREGFLFNPDSSQIVKAGDVLIVLGSKENLNKFKEIYVKA